MKDIQNIMNDIQYGYLYNGINIFNHENEYDIDEIYHLQSPEEVLHNKYAICWDQVELERKLFQEKNYPIKTYFIYYLEKQDQLFTHTFLVYKENDKYYWYENAWDSYKGIHEYKNIDDCLEDIFHKFINEKNPSNESTYYLYEYKTPPYHITSYELFQFIRKQKLVQKIDKLV